MGGGGVTGREFRRDNHGPETDQKCVPRSMVIVCRDQHFVSIQDCHFLLLSIIYLSSNKVLSRKPKATVKRIFQIIHGVVHLIRSFLKL